MHCHHPALVRRPVWDAEDMQAGAGAVGPLAPLAALPAATSGLSRRRLLTGFGLCLAGLPLLTWVMVGMRSSTSRESALLIYLLAVVVVAVVGGILPGLLAAVEGFLLVNWFLTPPYNTLTVAQPTALTDLVVFVLAAAIVSVTVEVGARNRAKAERNRLQTHMVASLTSAEISGVSVEDILEQIRRLYGMSTVSLAAADSSGEPVAVIGERPHGSPVLTVAASDTLTLFGYGNPVFAEDRVLLQALAATAGRAWETARLAQEAARAEQLAQTDKVRAALLTAVGHDLRTPLAGIKAAASGLRQTDLTWAPGEQQELVATIEAGADRLAALVDNLLAMSRLQAGALSVHLDPVDIEEVVSRALLALGANSVVVDVPPDLPSVVADAGLLERVLANLVDNATRFSPPGEAVTVKARLANAGIDDVVRIDVVDHGTGVDPQRWNDMFLPFQRLGDATPGGIGLGLAIARGLADAMGGSLTPTSTVGGGLTMSVDLPVCTP
jgi:K+-sensing histidine kinase KdpD